MILHNASFFRRWALFAALCLCLCLCLGLVSCAQKAGPNGPNGARALWKEFQRTYRLPDDASGFSLRASLHYKGRKKSVRTLLRLWGEFELPARLDVTASLGPVLTHVRQDQNRWLGFFPDESRAYTHHDALTAQKMLGLPFPFTLDDLARLACGDISGLVPADYDRAEVTGRGVVYHFDSGPVRSLRLDPEARPLGMSGGEPGWTLAFEGYGKLEGPLEIVPAKTTLSRPPERAVLRIKSVEFKVSPWPAKALVLELPEKTTVVPLDHHKPVFGEP